MRHLWILVVMLFSLSVNAKGIVQLRDSVTGETLPYGSVVNIEGRKKRLTGDKNGIISIPENLRHSSLKASYSGFSDKIFTIGETDTILTVWLLPKEYDLEEVMVKPKKEKYSKKNNPAVDFVERLRKDAKKYDPKSRDKYSYDKYEKTLIGINNFNGRFDSGFYSKNVKFLENYIDTSSYTGARILDLVLKEKYSTKIFSTDPKADKEIIIGYRSEGVDEAFNEDNMRIFLEDVLREVDVYEPNINILQNRFVSPLSSLGPDFYKYYLTDSVFVGDEKCIELTFVPRNYESMGFNGKLYVPVGDTTMFVKKITMRTPHDINLNFLQNLYINQNFVKDSLGYRHKAYEDLVLEMQIVRGTPEFYGRKTAVYDNFSYQPREEFHDYYERRGDVFTVQDSVGQTAQFWNEKRMIPLSRAETRIGNFTTEMRKVSFIYWAEKVVKLLESGYFTTGNPSKIDIGPINTFISYNSVEGIRLRGGAMTMAALNPHLFIKGYVAYGFKDHRWKYSGTIEYSFTKKKKHAYEWPRHGIYASYTYDLDLIGQHYLFTNQDNFVLSLKRKESNLVTYRKLAEIGYVLELPNNFSIEVGGKFTRQESTRYLPFIFPDGRIIDNYKDASFNVSLRWAKGEKFVQGRNTRLLVNMDPWIIQLTQEYGPKGLFGACFTTNRTELSVQKRFWMSAFGYIDVIAKAGKVWSSVYYPGLMWPNANLSYTIQPESYSLMNPMEFANDKYASIDFTYFGNGILFNRIPGIKKLKLREAVTFKGLMGGLSDKNNPLMNQNILAFPVDAQAMKMKSTPYMEIGAGIDNILSVLRVDYVWRLTYRDTPGVDRSGLRVSLHFTL